MHNTWKFNLLFILLLFNLATPSFAIDVTLKWTENNEPDLAGYRIFFREEGQSYNYASPYWETTEPICTIYDLDEATTYFFVVRAFDFDGFESNNSNEVRLESGTIPAHQSQIEDNNENVLYGSGGRVINGCFIATAAYGSLMEPHVQILCDFRDRFLLTHSVGKNFVHFYYKYSPPAAGFIAKHDSIRALVCAGLLPLVGFGWVTLKVGIIPTMVLMLLSAVVIIGCIRSLKKTIR